MFNVGWLVMIMIMNMIMNMKVTMNMITMILITCGKASPFHMPFMLRKLWTLARDSQWETAG